MKTVYKGDLMGLVLTFSAVLRRRWEDLFNSEFNTYRIHSNSIIWKNFYGLTVVCFQRVELFKIKLKYITIKVLMRN